MHNLVIPSQFGVTEKNGIPVVKQKGVVYLIESDNCVKIGRTINPKVRFQTLRTQSGRTIKRTFHTVPCNNYCQVEASMHSQFNGHRIVGEWFNIPFEEALKALESYKLDAKDKILETDQVSILDEFDNHYFDYEIQKFLNERPAFKRYVENNGFRIYASKTGEIIVTNNDDVDMDIRLFIAIYKSEVMP